jgi:hypothetical protein
MVRISGESETLTDVGVTTTGAGATVGTLSPPQANVKRKDIAMSDARFMEVLPVGNVGPFQPDGK